MSGTIELKAKTVIQVLLVAVALLGLLSVGLALRPSQVTIQTLMQTAYVTQTVSSVQSLTVTSFSEATVTESVTSSQGNYVPGYNGYYCGAGQPCNNANCGYPFNPYLCNEGPPVTVVGYLTNDTTCVNLYTGDQNYVVWNLPQTEPQGVYQVYGFTYPHWPSTQPFPPYPFQTTLCEGIPLWAVPPYIQSGT